LADPRKEPSLRLRIGGLAAAVAALAVFSAAPAQAGSLHMVFPQSAEATVVQGQSAPFTLELSALGATRCSATTAPVRVATLYSVDAVGDVAPGLPGDIPIQTAENRGSSENCSIHVPVIVPLTVTAAADTPVGDYLSVIRYGKGGDGGVDLDGPPLTIHVIAPAQAPAVLPPAELTPGEILVLGVRVAKPRPKFAQTELIARVKGSVRFRMPGGASRSLGDPMIVPNGTVVDATDGVVKVTVERTAGGTLDSVDAWDGAFHMAQGTSGITVLTLTGAVSASRHVARAAAAVRKRSLWVNGKGNFKTRGKRASAIVRGTYWHTEETAAGTKVQVKRGLVAVRDFARHVTVLVAAGKSYLARPRTAAIRRIPAFTGSTQR
jgi:hypothetical protein